MTKKQCMKTAVKRPCLVETTPDEDKQVERAMFVAAHASLRKAWFPTPSPAEDWLPTPAYLELAIMRAYNAMNAAGNQILRKIRKQYHPEATVIAMRDRSQTNNIFASAFAVMRQPVISHHPVSSLAGDEMMCFHQAMSTIEGQNRQLNRFTGQPEMRNELGVLYRSTVERGVKSSKLVMAALAEQNKDKKP